MSGRSTKGVFISYRRGATSGQARALNAELASRFGAPRIFMDVDSITPGRDFVEQIDNAVKSCGVVLALIGPDWTGRQGRGKPLLNDPDDFVRRELRAALEHQVPIIPILVERTSMPNAADLPDELRVLSRYQALELENSRWSADVARLTDAIETLAASDSDGGERSPARWWKRPVVLGAAFAAVAIVAAVAALAIGGSSSSGGKTPAHVAQHRGTHGSGPTVIVRTRTVVRRTPPIVTTKPAASSGPPSGLTACDQNISVNSHTTCSFADNVFRHYARDVRSAGGPTSFSVDAYSPTTGLRYTDTCDFNSTSQIVLCSHGTDLIRFPYAAAAVYHP